MVKNTRCWNIDESEKEEVCYCDSSVGWPENSSRKNEDMEGIGG